MYIQFSGHRVISARNLTKREQVGNGWKKFRPPIAMSVTNGCLVYAGNPPLGCNPGLLFCAEREGENIVALSRLRYGRLIGEPVHGPMPIPADILAAIRWEKGVCLQVGSVYLIPSVDEFLTSPGVFLVITREHEILVLEDDDNVLPLSLA